MEKEEENEWEENRRKEGRGKGEEEIRGQKKDKKGGEIEM